jgi:putative transposase
LVRQQIEEHRVNHKPVYRWMRDVNLLLFRKDHNLINTSKRDCEVALKESNTRWCSVGLEMTYDKREIIRLAFVLHCFDRGEVMNGWPAPRGLMQCR